jgi:hypothetical protein
MDKPKLIDHRKALSENPDAYSFELDDQAIHRLVKTLVPHLKHAGFNVSPSKNSRELSEIVKLLFTAQDNLPFFHVEGTELPLCWNSPKDWGKNYIKYEWGHLRSRNQAQSDAHSLTNLGLYSARCNQHIQTSLHIEELMVYGGVLAQRISNVLSARRKLFESEDWNRCVEKIA